MIERATKHETVMLAEAVELLSIGPGDRVIDATVGGAGHSLAIGQRLGAGGMLIGFDLDAGAIGRARKRLASLSVHLQLVQANFAEMRTVLRSAGIESVDGIIFDLGVSSDLLEEPDRGFSFSHDGPLDMRFKSDAPLTAAQLVNSSSVDRLAQIFRMYGQEPHSRHYARVIFAASRLQPIETTFQLRDLIYRHTPASWRAKLKIDPCTRIFQALRIAVNDELESLGRVLPEALSLLRPGGRMVVISFHSLEDGLVKHFFKEESRGCICPVSMPVCRCGHQAQLRLITKRPVFPSQAEIARNPRARSARMRVAERLPVQGSAEQRGVRHD
ncbi:16S rRNA (cytosine(1402)-N(4))-methyltransferase RsmH [bacterium]|nr:16S rRNA (cytosine(1402)-N(4))-methyltransferase RsmH [bacterium]